MRPHTRFCLILLTIGSLLMGVGCDETEKQRLSVTVAGSGIVSSDPAGIECGQDCQHDFSSGTQVTLTATPEDGYELESWGGDCSGSGPTCQLALSEDRAVTATFVQSSSETKRLSVTVSGSGSVSSDPAGIDCGQDCQHDFSSGSQVTLIAAPETGYELESWGGACSGSASTCQLQLNEDLAVTATFAESGDEDPCEGVSCSGHGSCEDGTCNCDAGYAGDDCSDCADGYVPSGDDCILDTSSVPLEGYGTDSSFGEAAGYEICTVSNLNDSGAGSLRDCIMNRNGPAADPTPRKVVFTVGGTITLTSDISLRQPHLTIDGLSAPSPGITIAKTGDGTDGEFRVTTWSAQETCAHDVLVQGLRYVGVWNTTSEEHSQNAGTLGIDGEDYPNCIENVVFNRITITNAQDSAGDIWGSAKRITYQYCAFINSLHPQSHSHWPGGETDQERRYISIHHNLYAYNHERQTNIRGNTWDYNFEQNIIHAWDPYGFGGGYATQFRCRGDGCPERLNLIGNYYTSSSATPNGSLSQAIVFNDGASTDQVYMRDNRFPSEESDRGTAALEFARTSEAEVSRYPHNGLPDKVLPKIGAPYRTPDELRLFGEVADEISGGSPDTKHLSVTVSGSGSVSSDPAGIECGQDCQHDFSAGTQVTLTATPEAGYELESWGGACSGSELTCQLALSEDMAVTASFVQSSSETKRLTVTVAGSGIVSSDPAGIECGQDCQHDFSSETQVTLTATPQDGCELQSWGGACSGSGSTCQLALSEDMAVTASFVQSSSETKRLSIIVAGSGIVSSDPAGIDCGQDCQHDFSSGTQVTLTATPEAGYELESWGGACSGLASTCQLELSEDRVVSATFVQDTTQGDRIYVDRQLAENCVGTYSIANRDCSGADGDAYTTPQDAADAAGPGDTVYFREGVYYDHENTAARFPVLHILKSGEAHAPITYMNYLDEEVILSGLNGDGDPYKYFTVLLGERPSSQQEISGQGVQNIVIQGLIVEGAARTGLLIAGPANQNASAQNPTENIVIRRVVARNNAGGNAAGNGINSMGKVVNVLIELCEAYDNTGNGIGFGRIAKDWHDPEPEDDMSAAQHSVIRNNLIYNNIHPTYPGNTDGMGGSHMYRCMLEDNVVFGNSDDGMDIYASIEVTIRSNIVFGHSYEGGNNAGIKFSAGGGGRHLVVKNIVLNNDSYSFEGSSPSNRLREYYPSKLYHNLAYNGSFGFSLAGNYTSASGFEVFHLRNNIALDNAGQQIFGEQAGKTDSDYNYISDANELMALQSAELDSHSISGDAQLGNPSLVIDTDFDPSWTVEEKLEHIRSQIRAAYCPSGSNLVDKGTLIDGYHNTDPGDDTGEEGEVWYGSAPDIGACEIVE